MKSIKISSALLFLLFIISCGTLNVYVKPGTAFNRKTTITIIGGNDELGTKGQLEHLLLSRGFNIVSESTAKTAIKYNDKIKGSDEINNEIQSELYSIKEMNSVYALELQYTYTYDLGGWYYKTFSSKVTDLNTGEVVLTANFSGYKLANSVLNELVDKISQNIK